MTTEIRVPALGESVSEATVGKWYKQQGDALVVDEPIVELETDKVTIDVPAPMAGVLTEISVKTGDNVEVGHLIAKMQAKENTVDAAEPASEETVAQHDVAESQKAPRDSVNEPFVSGQAESETTEGQKDGGQEMPPAPSAAKIMAENNVQADALQGSGKRGQILKADVLEAIATIEAGGNEKAMTDDAVAQPKSAMADEAPTHHERQKEETSLSEDKAAKETTGEERVRMTKLRQTIAKRLKSAQNTAAMLTTFNEVDMSAIIALRKKYRDLFQRKHDVKLGFMGFFTKAVCHALKEVPAVNAEIDGTDIIYKKFAHIGIAVGTDKGLVVPVVRNADQLSIAEIEKEISRLGKEARLGKLSLADMQGGTFTITNGGIYGSLMSTPILNAPQSGILGMHAIKERPIAVDGKIEIRPMMYLAVSYDHRIVDGQEAVTFLVRIKESLENPERLVLDL